MNDDNLLHALLLSWILYSVSTEPWLRWMGLSIGIIVSVSGIVKFFVS